MRWLLLLLSLAVLVACVPAEQLRASTAPVLKSKIKCWDGSFVGPGQDCPVQEAVVGVPDVAESVVSKPVAREVDVLNTSSRANNASRPIANVLLDEAREAFDAMAWRLDDGFYILRDGRARYMLDQVKRLPDDRYITDVYLNLNSRSAVAYCDIEREVRFFGGNYDFKALKCRDVIDVPLPVSFSDWVQVSPLYWLREFVDLQPVLVEQSEIVLPGPSGSRIVQPSVHFVKNGEKFILRIDSRYHVPVRIEEEGKPPIDYRYLYFDVMTLDGGTQKISKKLLSYQNASEFWLK